MVSILGVAILAVAVRMNTPSAGGGLDGAKPSVLAIRVIDAADRPVFGARVGSLISDRLGRANIVVEPNIPQTLAVDHSRYVPATITASIRPEQTLRRIVRFWRSAASPC